MASRDAYYNENDAFASAWLKNLIDARLIAPGDVDVRSIVDVRGGDLAGYRQCHFFAGIGVWSHALRCAGWPDDRAVWTGSCPCGPFSGAGKKLAFDDPRHLWPELFRLVAERMPRVVLGEQVASPAGLAWVDLVQSDMEAKDYAFAALDLCAAGIGAPHIRQRLYWVADAGCDRLHYQQGDGGEQAGEGQRRDQSVNGGRAGLVVDADHEGSQGRDRVSQCADQRFARPDRLARVLDDTKRDGRGTGRNHDIRHERVVAPAASINAPAGPVNGFWRDADWLLCRDGRWRPVEPGTFPLAHGAAARVGRLRGYGNALVAPLAQAFIEAVMEVIP